MNDNDQNKERKAWLELNLAFAKQTVINGIGACDALYELAVKCGANEIEAAGFAHHINGAFALLEGYIVDGTQRENTLMNHISKY